MTAVPKDLYVEQGATFGFGFNWYHEDPGNLGHPDLTNPYAPVSARMQIREFISAPEFVLEATTEDGRIVLGPDGRFDITFTDIDTDLLTMATAVYDLEAVLPDDSVRRLLEGGVTIDANVTRT